MPRNFAFAGTMIRDAAALCAKSIRQTFAAHLSLYVCCIVFCGLTLAVALIWHIPLPFDSAVSFVRLLLIFLPMFVGLTALIELVRLFREKHDRPLLGLGQWLHRRTLAGDRPGNTFHTLATFTPLMIAFSALKEQIPKIHPFAWDHTFMRWDRALGFGHQPWQILQPILGYPVITTGFNFAYDLWFFAMFGTLIWQAFATRQSILRTQFLLAVAFAWFIAGNVLAVVLSSAGPCFYGHFFAHDPYAAQMRYLHAVAAHWPVWSIGVQDMLWQSYIDGHGAFAGISAMPSMHVTIAVLMALLCWNHDRRLGIAGWIFTGLIIIGSIHLAWHYAVDALAGAFLAVMFWKAAGIVARAEARRGAALIEGDAVEGILTIAGSDRRHGIGDEPGWAEAAR